MKVLSVGSGGEGLPKEYDGWEQVRLDIDEKHKPDIVADARMLWSLPPAEYDAIYCDHCLEHFSEPEVLDVLKGCLHLLQPNGYLEIIVPDLRQVMEAVVLASFDIDTILYKVPLGAIRVLDILYGHQAQVKQSPFMTHKSGFTVSYLNKVLRSVGFTATFKRGNLEFTAKARRI